MTRYMSLINFTEKGLREVKESGKRAAEFRASVEAAGGKIISQYWAIGAFDGCVVFEVPDEAAAASLLLALGRAGNVRTETLRLYDDAEFTSIVDKV